MIIDYSKCSSEILKTKLSEKDFTFDYVYRVFGNEAFNYDISYTGDGLIERNNCYMELFVPTNTKNLYNVYSTAALKNYFVTSDAGNVIIEDPRIFVNEKRRWMMDKIYQLINDIPQNTPLYIQVKFSNYPKIGCPLKWVAQITPSDGNPYTISEIQRKTIWVYEPNKPVYLLINFIDNNPNIYVMQSLNIKNYENLSINNVDYIGKFLNLPENWIWTSMILDNETYLKVVSVGTAYLTTDTLGNSYQYLDPKYAPWLYEHYYQLNTVF